MRLYKMVVAGLLLASAAFAQQATKPVQTKQGQLTGVVKDGVSAYLGVPFAKAPVGELRWKPPQATVAWQGVRKADKFGAACTQPEVKSFLPWTEEFMNLLPVSEDCLFLNVWTAAKASEKQAVMVWIHGGGFGGGAGSIAIYDGAELAKKGVVVVTLNYRVGALGFLVHPELTKESEHHSSGNYGLLDQIAALQWVKENIAAFGGDPVRVTIFGQSAGAVSVVDLMKSPLAQGLFARAIVQSDPAVFLPNDPMLRSTKLEEREQQGLKYQELLGAKSLAEMRKLPADAFFQGSAFPDPNSKVKSTVYRGGPVVDGWFLTDEPISKQVPVMNGFVAGDANFVDGLGPPPPATVAVFEESAKKQFGGSAGKFLKLYPVKQDADVAAARKQSREDQARVGLAQWATEQVKRSPVVYTFFFDRAIPWPQHPEFGAFHTAEVPYVFRNLKVLDRPWEPVDFKLSDVMSTYWVNFASTGDPNGAGVPAWPAFKADKQTTMELGERVGEMRLAEPARVQFFADYLKKK